MLKWVTVHKWKMAWGCFAILIALFCIVMYFHHNKNWFGNFVSAFGVLLTLYPTLLIFVQSRADSDKSTREQLDHLQKLSQAEIEVNRDLNQKQIDKIDLSTREQIEEFRKTTAAQIKAIEENTNKQIQEQNKLTEQHIAALMKATQLQIDNYAKQTNEVVARLEDNSILLAEILLRQLEEKLGELSGHLNNAQARYEDLQGFKFLRTPKEREDQLARQRGLIQKLEQAVTYVRNKLQQVKTFLSGK